VPTTPADTPDLLDTQTSADEVEIDVTQAADASLRGLDLAMEAGDLFFRGPRKPDPAPRPLEPQPEPQATTTLEALSSGVFDGPTIAALMAQDPEPPPRRRTSASFRRI
jgi:hypothetical protein